MATHLETTPARRAVVLAGVMAAMFLAAMESTVVATAMPTVIASLGGIRIYSWTFSAFLLTSTVSMPIWGRLADHLGRRPAYLIGLGVFLAGSALAGLSQSMEQLIAFRALQGVGAGSLITIGMTIVGDLYGMERRAKMQGYFSSVWGVASLVGPLIGGVLTDRISWRWVFYVNIPFGLLAAAAIAAGLRDEVRIRTRTAFDVVGMTVFVAAISTLKGPRHGGANEDVLALLLEIGEPARAEALVEARIGARASLSKRDRSDPRTRVPGFGHRVYKVDDARARVLRGMAKSMAEATGRGKLFEVAERLYDAMKARTTLPVNVDFFSAVVYDALGIPPDFCTSIFAVGRVAGWCAHAMEQYADNRLIRPRADYIGVPARALP